MRRTLAVAVCLIVLLSAVSLAATTRQLTPEETAAITAYLDARRAAYEARNMGREDWSRRQPGNLCREYERYKMFVGVPGVTGDRWTARPKFPGWDAKHYKWYPKGKYYTQQLYCEKCKVLRPESKGWVNPNGFTCQLTHPLPVMEQWRFTVRLVATDHKKPIEAKAHIWNALQHQELTEAQWDELMVVVDAIPPPE